jgi:hypothetical protein
MMDWGMMDISRRPTTRNLPNRRDEGQKARGTRMIGHPD